MRKVTLRIVGTMMAAALAAGNAGFMSATPVMAAEQSAAVAEANPGSEASAQEFITGGWEVNQRSLSLEDNKDARAAFEKATDGLVGYTYEVIAYLGSQVVAGTNYSYLCRGTVVYPGAESEYVIVNVYEDLSGNATITCVQELLDVPTDENVTGGWEYNQGETSLEKNPEVKKALDKGLHGLVGASYDPVAYIGSQVVAGTNYAVLCSVTPSVPDGERHFTMVTVYEDLGGNASITGEADVNLAADKQTESGSKDGAKGFSDLEQAPYAAEAISWAVGKKITSGYSDGRFGVNDPVTREQFVTFLWRMAGKPETSVGSSFADENSISSWAKTAVNWAVGTGVVAGIGGNQFAPKEKVTREQAAEILFHYYKGSAPADGKSFPDVKKGQWYTDAALWAADAGIIQGLDDGTFGVGKTATRAQTIQMLYNAAR